MAPNGAVRDAPHKWGPQGVYKLYHYLKVLVNGQRSTLSQRAGSQRESQRESQFGDHAIFVTLTESQITDLLSRLASLFLKKQNQMPRTTANRQPTSSKWCFVLNNPEEDEIKDLFLGKESKIVYAVWQYEEGEQTHTKHIQGYVILKRHQDLNWMKRFISLRLSARIANGDTQSNIVYCTKELTRLDGPWTIGEVPLNEQGKRNDLLVVQQEIDAGIPMRDIATDHFSSFVKYHRGFGQYQAITAPCRTVKSQVILLIGKTSIGKSWWARNNTKGTTDGHGFPAWDRQWFDGYNGTDDLIFNDFTGDMDFTKLLQILDEGAYTLQVKGGVVQLNAKRIVFTSNFIMEQWYDYVKIKADFNAFKRRFDYIFDVTEEPEMVYYFTKEWTEKQNIADPYPHQINWDEEIQLDSEPELESTVDVLDAAYNCAEGGFFCDEEKTDNQDEYEGEVIDLQDTSPDFSEEELSDYEKWEQQKYILKRERAHNDAEIRASRKRARLIKKRQ